MQQTIIGRFRSATLARRIICATIIVMFGGLVTAPAVAGVRQEYKTWQVNVTVTENVAGHLAKVLEKTRRVLKKALVKTVGKAGKPDWIEIKNLHHTIETLDKQVSDRFNHIEMHLKRSHLPDVILQRQTDAVTKYRKHIDALLDALEVAESADNAAAAHAALEKVSTMLTGAKFKASPQPFDPGKLPFGVPKNEARKPQITSKALKAELTSSSSQTTTLAAATMANYAANDPENPAYLTATPDIQLTDAIEAKAAALNHDPVKIYNWVHNNIEYIPSYGSIQGADQTLKTLRGNDFDTASLLIALLRASNIPARYVYGTVTIPIDKVMNWVGGVTAPQAALQLLGQGGIPNIGLAQGGVIKSVRLEHVWVEAWLDFYPSRGARNIKGDSWTPLDASFKQYTYKSGMDFQGQVPFDGHAFAQHLTDTATIDKEEGWIQGIDQTYIQSQINTYQQQVKDFIDSQNPDATVSDVLGAKTIIKRSASTLAASLPYHLVAVGNRLASLPDNLRWKFTYKLVDRYGSELMSYTVATPALAGKAFALSFKPATEADVETIGSYLPNVPPGDTLDPSDLPDSLPGYPIHLTPEISLNGQTVKSQGSYAMGTELHAQEGYWSPTHGWQLKSNTLTVGEYQAIGLDLQGVAPERLTNLKTQLVTTQDKLDANDLAGLTGHDLTGAILQAGVLSYFAVNDAQDRLASRAAGLVQYREPSYGTFKTIAQTVYSFGVPHSVSFPGVNMDINWYLTSAAAKDGNTQKRTHYYLATGPRISAFEHIIPEQLFSMPDQPVKGVSAIKALAIAASQGQRIYAIDADNINVALPQLKINKDIEVEIRSAVNAGQQATVSQNAVSYAGWHGTGYVILDPATGAGAYKISGGANGGSSIGSPGDLLDIFGDLLLIAGSGQTIASFFAKAGIQINKFKFGDYKTAFKDAGRLVAAVSAILAVTEITAETGSLWKGLAAGAIDLTLTLIAGYIGTLLFGALSALAIFSPVIVGIVIAITIGVIMAILERILFERLFSVTLAIFAPRKFQYA